MKCSIGGMRIVSRVLDLLFPPRETERLVREASRTDTLSLLSPTLVPGTIPATALMRYDDPLAHALILEAKFSRNERAVALLGELVHDFLLEWSADRIPGETRVLIPIPLSKEREKRRGYNQVERIARAGIQNTDISLASGLLSRIRETAPQTSLSGTKRRENMRGSFSAIPLDPAHTYIVIDDVTTTGATLLAATQALRASGAKDIVLLALAH